MVSRSTSVQHRSPTSGRADLVLFYADPVSVRGRTIDSLMVEHHITHVDVMKVDVEGFEAHVFLEVAGLFTGPQPPTVAFEFSDLAGTEPTNSHLGWAQEVMLSYEYRLWTLGPFLRGRASLQAPLTSGFETILALQ